MPWSSIWSVIFGKCMMDIVSKRTKTVEMHVVGLANAILRVK